MYILLVTSVSFIWWRITSSPKSVNPVRISKMGIHLCLEFSCSSFYLHVPSELFSTFFFLLSCSSAHIFSLFFFYFLLLFYLFPVLPLSSSPVHINGSFVPFHKENLLLAQTNDLGFFSFLWKKPTHAISWGSLIIQISLTI